MTPRHLISTLTLLLCAPLLLGARGSDGGGGSDRVDRVSGGSRGQQSREVDPRDTAKAGDRTARDAGTSDSGKSQQDVKDRQGNSGGERTDKATRDYEAQAEREARALEEGQKGGRQQSDGSSGRQIIESGGSDGSGGSGSSGSGSSGSGGSGSGGSGSSGSNSGSGSSDSGSGSSGSGSDDDSSDHSGSGSGGSGSSSDSGTGDNSFRGLAARERPEFDAQGFPAKRGEVLSSGLSKGELSRARALGFTVIERVPLKALGGEMVRLRAPAGVGAAEAIKLLRPESEAEIDYDHFYAASGDPVPGPARAPARIQTSAEKTLWIGMIDTGIAANRAIGGLHIEAQDFAGAAVPVAHGTAVASILRRVGAARITSANVFTDDARPYAPADRIIRALDWLVARNVPVINISIAGPENAVVNRAIAAAIARGHLVVAAAGNGGPAAPPAFPGASPGAVAVTAVDADARVYLRANRGNYVDIAAPGVGVAAALPDGTMKLHSGTSFASPIAAAWLARCVGPKPGRRAQACRETMEARARDLGAPGRDPVYGFGLLIP